MTESSDLSRDLSALKLDRDAPAPVRRTGSVLLGLLLGLMIGGAGGWYSHDQYAVKPPSKVQVATVAAPQMAATGAVVLTAGGYLVSDHRVDLTPTGSGRIVELDVHEGDKIKAGQVLIRLDERQARARVESAEAELADATHDRDRTQTLVGTGSLMTADLETAVLRVQRAQADLDALVAARSDLTLRSPIDGTVCKRDVDVGESVNFSTVGATAAFVIADLTRMYVEIQLAEADLARVRPGQPASVVTDAYPDQKWPGRVEWIAPLADRARGTVEVRVRIDAPADPLRPDLSAKVEVREDEAPEVSADAVALVPRTAVIDQGGRAIVWVVDGGLAHRRDVVVGSARGDRVEVRQGVRSGEQVIVGGEFPVVDGAAVLVQ